MDDRVIRSMARWPDVPDVFGWLALDARGHWLLKGETIANRAAVAFIARNYAHDEFGRWFFQNGPQRVFVALHVAPWVFRIGADGALTNHIDRVVGTVTDVFVDETGAVLLDTPALASVNVTTWPSPGFVPVAHVVPNSGASVVTKHVTGIANVSSVTPTPINVTLPVLVTANV